MARQEEMQVQLNDLKESVAIKMSVADDLQKLLDESRRQVKDVKQDQRQLQNEKE